MTSLVAMYIWAALTVCYFTFMTSITILRMAPPEIQEKTSFPSILSWALCIGTGWPLVLPAMTLFVIVGLARGRKHTQKKEEKEDA